MSREKIVAAAVAYNGVKEGSAKHKEIIDRYNSYKPLPRGYKVTYTDAWCATFVSSIAIKCGLQDIFPIECSCNKQIAQLKEKGAWIEKDSYVPKLGDIIYYDWQDSGKGDNKGYSDHVGIVVSVENNKVKVIEGNKNNAVGYRTLAINGKYIRGYGVPKYTAVNTPNLPVEEQKTEVGTSTYKVKKGDIPERIAKAYGITVAQLVAANIEKYPRITRDFIVTGWVLNIPGSEKTTKKVKITPSNGLNVRTGAGIGYTKIGALKYGTIVEVLEEKNNWGRILYNGKNGWISLQYTRAV